MNGVRYLSESAVVVAGGGDSKKPFIRGKMADEDLPLVIVNPDAMTQAGVAEAIGYSRQFYPSRHVGFIMDTAQRVVDAKGTEDATVRINAFLDKTDEDTAKVYGSRHPARKELIEGLETLLKTEVGKGRTLADVVQNDLKPFLEQKYPPLLSEKLDALEADITANPKTFLKTFKPEIVPKERGYFEAVTNFFTTLGGLIGGAAENKKLLEIEKDGRERMETTMKAHVPKVFYAGLDQSGLEVVYCKDTVTFASGAERGARGVSAGNQKMLFFREGGLDGPTSREEALHMLDTLAGKLTNAPSWKEGVHKAIGAGINLGTMSDTDPAGYQNILDARQLLTQAQTWIGKFYSIAYGNEHVVTSLGSKHPDTLSSRVYPEILPDMMHVQKMLSDVPTLHHIGKNARPLGNTEVDRALVDLQQAVRLAESNLTPGENIFDNKISTYVFKEALNKMSPNTRDALIARFGETVPAVQREQFQQDALTQMKKTFGGVVDIYVDFVENAIPAMSGQAPVKITEVYYETERKAVPPVRLDEPGVKKQRGAAVVTEFEGGPATQAKNLGQQVS